MPDPQTNPDGKHTKNNTDLQGALRASLELVEKKVTDSRPFRWNSKQKARQLALEQRERDPANPEHACGDWQSPRKAMEGFLR